MKLETIEIIFFGDIVGNKALSACIEFANSPRIKKDRLDEKSVQFIVANAENVSNGFGLAHEAYKRLVTNNFDALTGGNHTWDNKEIHTYISGADKLVRPCNLPSGAPGMGWRLFEKKGIKLGVINAMGRTFMGLPLECPFRSCDKAIDELRSKNADLILVDFHAEATSEKNALGYYLDGRASVIVGSHTHVQTADERILPKGTAFITDAGGCIALDSVIGMTPESILPKFLTGLPGKTVVSEKQPMVRGIRTLFELQDGKNPKVQKIERIGN